MYTLIAENERGEQLELTHNKNYDIIEHDGFDPPDATINTSTTATVDGSRFNNSRVNNRQIIINLSINGPAEDNRIYLYKFFSSKRKVRIYYKNNTRDVYIDGYVEKMGIAFFEQKQHAQITILCPFPFFKGTSENVRNFYSVESKFEFPFSIASSGVEFSTMLVGNDEIIVNYGDVDTGVVINLLASGDVVNPAIYNTETGEKMILGITLKAGDEVIINTNVGEKEITLISDGIEKNIIGTMQPGSTWFKMRTGDNVFSYNADEGVVNISCMFAVRDLYEGV